MYSGFDVGLLEEKQVQSKQEPTKTQYQDFWTKTAILYGFLPAITCYTDIWVIRRNWRRQKSRNAGLRP